MIRVFVEGIGIAGPGLDGWAAARPVLAGQVPYEPSPFVPRPVSLLPAAERRRAGNAIRLAIGVGIEALTNAARDPAAMAMVFTSSSGDTDTISDILCVLASERREVSPTRFHNSVHNAPAGYWAVATGSRQPSTTLCAYDSSFSAGLLDAAAQTMVDRRPVALVAYDLAYPEPLNTVRPIEGPFATALALTDQPSDRCVAVLTISPDSGLGNATPMADPALERLRIGNPAARALPLLTAIARDAATTIRLESGSGTSIVVRIEPP